MKSMQEREHETTPERLIDVMFCFLRVDELIACVAWQAWWREWMNVVQTENWHENLRHESVVIIYARLHVKGGESEFNNNESWGEVIWLSF
jgi:hypothetical protein